MRVLSHISRYLSLERDIRHLFLEAFLCLGWARLLMYLPFAKVAPSLGAHMQETSIIETPINRLMLKRVHQAIQIMSNHTFWDSKCLIKAIAGMKMLERRKIESTLYLGTARDETGKMIAHAWLRSGPFYITGKEGMERFTVVSKFAKQTGA